MRGANDGRGALARWAGALVGVIAVTAPVKARAEEPSPPSLYPRVFLPVPADAGRASEPEQGQPLLEPIQIKADQGWWVAFPLGPRYALFFVSGKEALPLGPRRFELGRETHLIYQVIPPEELDVAEDARGQELLEADGRYVQKQLLYPGCQWKTARRPDLEPKGSEVRVHLHTGTAPKGAGCRQYVVAASVEVGVLNLVVVSDPPRARPNWDAAVAAMANSVRVIPRELTTTELLRTIESGVLRRE